VLIIVGRGPPVRLDRAYGDPTTYARVDLGRSREIAVPWNKPRTPRFDVVYALDQSYVPRDGAGIGVFAPQYGPRRGFFLGASHAF
jgi:hypothetical protein